MPLFPTQWEDAALSRVPSQPMLSTAGVPAPLHLPIQGHVTQHYDTVALLEVEATLMDILFSVFMIMNNAITHWLHS